MFVGVLNVFLDELVFIVMMKLFLWGRGQVMSRCSSFVPPVCRGKKMVPEEWLVTLS